MKFTLLEISWYGWNGISVCSFETDWHCRSLFHVERTEGTWKFSLLFRNFFI
jgi:hypothetical protein